MRGDVWQRRKVGEGRAPGIRGRKGWGCKNTVVHDVREGVGEARHKVMGVKVRKQSRERRK